MSGAESECTALLPSDFINLSMRRKVIGKIIFPALNDSYVYRSYKIMPRAQNSYSYMIAAFLVQFNNERDAVLKANICFGGISPDLEHAERTEKFLVGKNIYNNEVLQQVCKKLLSEIQPEAKLPPAPDEYLKNLAVSLFYKFVLNTAPKGIVDQKFIKGSYLLKREISTASQEFEYVESRSKLYKRIPKVDGAIQCTGEAQYVNDLPRQHNELYAAFILGDKVNGIVQNVDGSEALKLKGVVAVYSAKDIPGKNNFMPECFDEFNQYVEEIFCSGKLLYHGQPVGVLIAETFDLAYQARNLVKVEYSFEKEGKNTSGLYFILVSLFYVFQMSQFIQLFEMFILQKQLIDYMIYQNIISREKRLETILSIKLRDILIWDQLNTIIIWKLNNVFVFLVKMEWMSIHHLNG